MNTSAAVHALLDTPAADDAAATLQPRDEHGRCGFQIGWDHARHGLVPPAELLIDGTPVGQGWRAGKAVFGRRQMPTSPALRGWLRLRTEAWLAGLPFDLTTVTPKWLAGIAVSACPVTRQALGGAPGADSAPVTVCLDAAAGYRAGNLVVLSRRAAAQEALLTPEQTARLAALRSCRTALPFCVAAGMPMRLLPPPSLQIVNPVQVLQACLTRQFATPGWSLRLRALADLLPADARGQADAALRHDFNLYIGAMAPRLLGAGVGSDGRVVDTALEDAWADQRVQRRWQHFAAALGEARTAILLERIAAQPAQRGSSPVRNAAGRRALKRLPAARPGTSRPPRARASGASAHLPAAAR